MRMTNTLIQVSAYHFHEEKSISVLYPVISPGVTFLRETNPYTCGTIIMIIV